MAVKPTLPSGKGVADAGQLAGVQQKFGNPREMIDTGVHGMSATKNDIGELSGFQADANSYLVKKGTMYGEAAKLNQMPPGMDISDQVHADIRNMPLKKITGTSYDGDGWDGGQGISD